MINQVLKFIGLNKIALFLILALLSSGFLLKTAYEKNGQLKSENKALNLTNHDLADAHDKRVAEFEVIQQSWLEREIVRESINNHTVNQQNELENLKDETNVRDVIIPADHWLFIKRSARDSGLPINQSNTDERDENT